MSKGHIDFREDPKCIKCGYNDLAWKYFDGTLRGHTYEYISLTCKRCGFFESMSCRDTVEITYYTGKLEKEEWEKKNKNEGRYKGWMPLWI